MQDLDEDRGFPALGHDEDESWRRPDDEGSPSPEAAEGLIAKLDAANERVCAEQRKLLRLIAQADRHQGWRDYGVRDLAHFLTVRYGISEWKTRRWIAAARALKGLPRLSTALETGELSLDKTIELTRFATPKTEARLITWAQGVSCARVREKADQATRPDLEQARQIESDRRLASWYHDEGRRYGIVGDFPAAAGALIDKALERAAEQIPPMPGEEGPWNADARRADALVATCSATVAADAEVDRATVVVHASVASLLEGTESAELDGGGLIHPETARRLVCDCRIQAVIEDAKGAVVGRGPLRRDPPAWMGRQLRYLDRECRFPGCGARRFLQAHHIVWRSRGGRTELANLVLVCAFHHKLVHEHGWSLGREPDGTVWWRRPDGTRYRAGPGPPLEVAV